MFKKVQIKVSYKALLLWGISGALLQFLGAYLGFKLMPDVINKKIWETKVLENNTQQWDIFMQVPFPFTFKVYLFEVQNPEEVLFGEKPVVKEVGPYVYKLFYWKSEVDIDRTNDEISYYNYMKFEFDQKASGDLSENDNVTILNLPYNSILLAAESTQPGLVPILNTGLDDIFSKNNNLFMTVSVNEFFFGGIRLCEHGGKSMTGKVICMQVKNKAKDAKPMRFEGSDILYATLFYKNNTHLGRFTVNSGKKSPPKSGLLTKYNGSANTSDWRPGEDTPCDKIRGITTVFPAEITPEMTFESFSEDICRVVKMDYKHEETVKSIPGLKFGAADDSFGNKNENSCFCINKTMNLDGNFGCLFDGVVDLTMCTGAPILVSYPHLLHADARYLNSTQGMSPNLTKHETFVVLEPNSGTPLKMAKRVQFNMFIRPIDGIPALENVTHALMPIFWVEESTTLGDEYIDQIQGTLLKVLYVVNVGRWSIIGIGLTIIFICLILFVYTTNY